MREPVTFLYRDEHVVVVDKPSGLAVHRGWAAERDVMMFRVRDALGTRVYPVHRLDRGASGALVFALDPASARALCDEFAAGRVAKRYLALVRGVPAPHLIIDYPLPNDEDGRERVPAVSEVERLEVIGRYSLVAVRPQTGRLHQIRRHLKHVSCPLIGDVRYGKGVHNRLFRERYGLHRLFLHAVEIAFQYSVHGEPVNVHAPLGEDLSGPLERLRAELEVAPDEPQQAELGGGE